MHNPRLENKRLNETFGYCRILKHSPRLGTAVLARPFHFLQGHEKGFTPARPRCLPATTTERAIPESLSVNTLKSGTTQEQINPELAPGMNTPPKNRS
jgi:hypothetical protein